MDRANEVTRGQRTMQAEPLEDDPKYHHKSDDHIIGLKLGRLGPSYVEPQENKGQGDQVNDDEDGNVSGPVPLGLVAGLLVDLGDRWGRVSVFGAQLSSGYTRSRIGWRARGGTGCY